MKDTGTQSEDLPSVISGIKEQHNQRVTPKVSRQVFVSIRAPPLARPFSFPNNEPTICKMVLLSTLQISFSKTSLLLRSEPRAKQGNAYCSLFDYIVTP